MKRIGSRILVVFLVVSLIAAGLTGCSKSESPADQQPVAQTKFINIATGGTAGTSYPLGGAMAEILNQNIPGVNATAQSTGHLPPTSICWLKAVLTWPWYRTMWLTMP